MHSLNLLIPSCGSTENYISYPPSDAAITLCRANLKHNLALKFPLRIIDIEELIFVKYEDFMNRYQLVFTYKDIVFIEDFMNDGSCAVSQHELFKNFKYLSPEMKVIIYDNLKIDLNQMPIFDFEYLSLTMNNISKTENGSSQIKFLRIVILINESHVFEYNLDQECRYFIKGFYSLSYIDRNVLRLKDPLPCPEKIQQAALKHLFKGSEKDFTLIEWDNQIIAPDIIPHNIKIPPFQNMGISLSYKSAKGTNYTVKVIELKDSIEVFIS